MHISDLRHRLPVARRVAIGRVAIELLAPGEAADAAADDPAPNAGFLLAVPLDGTLGFAQNGRSGIAGAGEYVLLNRKMFFQLQPDPEARVLLLHMPTSDLRGKLASIEDHVGRRFAPNPHMGRLLVALLRDVADIFADRDPPNPEALATEIVGFVALAVGAEDRGAALDVRNARYHLRRRIFDFIESNLGDQDLSPKKIAASSRISLSYLYSLFSDDETTVGQFVQGKRLQRAYEILVADPRRHRTVSEIAYEVGFKNVSHFSRSFSRHFRVAPRDVRPVAPLACAADERRTVHRATEARPVAKRYWADRAQGGHPAH